MTPEEYIAFFGELEALCAEQLSKEQSNINLYPDLLAELDAIGREPKPVCLGPEIVAEALSDAPCLAQAGKENAATPVSEGQCATHTPSITSPIDRSQSSKDIEQKDDQAVAARPNPFVQSSSQSVTPKRRARPYAGHPSLAASRQPRRKAARLHEVAGEKTWEGTRRRNRKDKLTAADKFSAAVHHTGAKNGMGVRLVPAGRGGLRPPLP